MSLKPRFGTDSTTTERKSWQDAWHDARKIALDAAQLADEWCYALDAWQRGDDREQPAPALGRSIGAVSDPTGIQAAIALGKYQAANEIATELLIIRARIAAVRERMGAARRVADKYTLAQAVDAARCAGMGKPGYPAWGLEECRELGVVDGICSSCLKHRLEWVKDNTYRRPVDGRRGARLPALSAPGFGVASHANLERAAERILEAPEGESERGAA